MNLLGGSTTQKACQPGRVGFRSNALRMLLAAAALLLAPALHALDSIALGQGVFAFVGSSDEASIDNGARVGNGGFIVGPTGTLVINTGTSYQHGREMLETAVRAGGQPVTAVVITQPLQEFLMGNAAFSERGITILAPAESAELIAARCAQCLDNLKLMLGDQTMAGTRIVVPETIDQSGDTVSVGGRELNLILPGRGSAPGDLAVFDRATGILFAGALVANRRIPELRDADVDGWHAALARLRALDLKTVVPGYGPIADATLIDETETYLTTLTAAVEAALEAGLSLTDALKLVTLPEYAGWARYEPVHRRNVQHEYLRLEAKRFGD